MSSLTKISSLLALGTVIVPCILFFFGTIELALMNWLALAGTIVWFVCTPLWMSKTVPTDADQVQI